MSAQDLPAEAVEAAARVLHSLFWADEPPGPGAAHAAALILAAAEPFIAAAERERIIGAVRGCLTETCATRGPRSIAARTLRRLLHDLLRQDGETDGSV